MLLRTANNAWKSIGPIILSAFSFFISSILIQLLAQIFLPDFSLVASRGMGKIIFIFAAFVQLFCFIALRPRKEATYYLMHAAGWPLLGKQRSLFLYFFVLFGIGHATALALYYACGNAAISYSTALQSLQTYSSFSLLISSFAALLVAWSEEFIFRGVLFGYFRNFYKPVPAVVLVSLIFALAHNLLEPWQLVLNQYFLGIGLFLLGVLFNLLMLQYNSIAAGAGAHAGLVFVKVLLRKFPFITVNKDTFFFPIDLRQAPFVHLLLLGTILVVYLHLRARSTDQ